MEMNEWDSDGFHRGLGQAGRAPRTPTLENIFEVFAKALKYCHLVESLISVGLVYFFFFPFCFVIISSGLVNGKIAACSHSRYSLKQTHTYQSVFFVAVCVLLTEPAHSMPHVSHILSCV